MSYQFLLISSALSLVLGAGLTYHFFPQIKTVEVEKEVVRTDIQTVTHTVTLPGGAVDTTITTIDHTQKVETDSKTSVSLAKPKINISALVANDFTRGGFIPSYGIAVSKEFIGPITIGGFGLTNGIFGLSIGINF